MCFRTIWKFKMLFIIILICKPYVLYALLLLKYRFLLNASHCHSNRSNALFVLQENFAVLWFFCLKCVSLTSILMLLILLYLYGIRIAYVFFPSTIPNYVSWCENGCCNNSFWCKIIVLQWYAERIWCWYCMLPWIYWEISRACI